MTVMSYDIWMAKCARDKERQKAAAASENGDDSRKRSFASLVSLFLPSLL